MERRPSSNKPVKDCFQQYVSNCFRRSACEGVIPHSTPSGQWLRLFHETISQFEDDGGCCDRWQRLAKSETKRELRQPFGIFINGRVLRRFHFDKRPSHHVFKTAWGFQLWSL